jgi:hypothetical protein
MTQNTESPETPGGFKIESTTDTGSPQAQSPWVRISDVPTPEQLADAVCRDAVGTVPRRHHHLADR